MAIPKKEMDVELQRLSWELDSIVKRHFEAADTDWEVFTYEFLQFREAFEDFKHRALLPGKRITKQQQMALSIPGVTEDAKAKEAKPQEKPKDVQQDSGSNAQVQRQRKTTARRN